MKELNSKEIETVKGGIVHLLAAAVAGYYGEKAGRWIYKKIFK